MHYNCVLFDDELQQKASSTKHESAGRSDDTDTKVPHADITDQVTNDDLFEKTDPADVDILANFAGDSDDGFPDVTDSELILDDMDPTEDQLISDDVFTNDQNALDDTPGEPITTTIDFSDPEVDDFLSLGADDPTDMEHITLDSLETDNPEVSDEIILDGPNRQAFEQTSTKNNDLISEIIRKPDQAEEPVKESKSTFGQMFDDEELAGLMSITRNASAPQDDVDSEKNSFDDILDNLQGESNEFAGITGPEPEANDDTQTIQNRPLQAAFDDAAVVLPEPADSLQMPAESEVYRLSDDDILDTPTVEVPHEPSSNQSARANDPEISEKKAPINHAVEDAETKVNPQKVDFFTDFDQPLDVIDDATISDFTNETDDGIPDEFSEFIKSEFVESESIKNDAAIETADSNQTLAKPPDEETMPSAPTAPDDFPEDFEIIEADDLNAWNSEKDSTQHIAAPGILTLKPSETEPTGSEQRQQGKSSADRIRLRNGFQLMIGEFETFLEEDYQISVGDTFPLLNHKTRQISVNINGQKAKGIIKKNRSGVFELKITECV